MFMAGTLSIDPSELTHIRKAVPQRAFKKLLYVLTAGLVSDQQEHETFTAISILQQLNSCLDSLGIRNVIRLAKDGIDIYHDAKGRADDMQDAMDAFLLDANHKSSELFSTLRLVLEHETDTMEYLIEIRVNRTHDVGTYPIEIEVNGVPTLFQAEETGVMGVLTKFEQHMGDQSSYNQMVVEMKETFGRFLLQLETAVKKEIQIDHVIRDAKPVMIRPMHNYHSPDKLHLNIRQGKPFFHGYFGWENACFYAFHWAGFVHDSSYHVSDFLLVDEMDNMLMSVGPIGFEAGSSRALSMNAPFEPPEGGDIALPPSSLAKLKARQKQATKFNENKSWFDFDMESQTPESDAGAQD